METISYWESRKTQENKSFLNKLNQSLSDNNINSDEAKELIKEHEKIKKSIDGDKSSIKKQLLAITKEELSSLSEWLWIAWNSSLNKTLRTLYKKWKASPDQVASQESQESQEPQDQVTSITQVDSQDIPEVIDNSKELSDFFSIDESKLDKLNSEINGIISENERWQNKLNILLKWYKDYIESNLVWLDSTILDKIKKSIWIRIWNLDETIENVIERKKSDKEWNYIWLLNWAIDDELSEINNKILPSALFMINADEKEDSIKTALVEHYTKNSKLKWRNKPKNPTDYYKKKAEKRYDQLKDEINEMFDANLDNSDWQFDELWMEYFNQSKTLQIDDDTDKIIFDVLLWNKENTLWEISILNKEEKEIESNAMAYYIAYVAITVIPYVWATVAVPSDIIDLFSSNEWVITALRTIWVVDDKFRMEKTYLDNILWWVWLVLTVFWLQALARWKKLVKAWSFADKVGIWAIEDAMAELWKKLWIPQKQVEEAKSLTQWKATGNINWVINLRAWKLENPNSYSNEEIYSRITELNNFITKNPGLEDIKIKQLNSEINLLQKVINSRPSITRRERQEIAIFWKEAQIKDLDIKEIDKIDDLIKNSKNLDDLDKIEKKIWKFEKIYTSIKNNVSLDLWMKKIFKNLIKWFQNKLNSKRFDKFKDLPEGTYIKYENSWKEEIYSIQKVDENSIIFKKPGGVLTIKINRNDFKWVSLLKWKKLQQLQKKDFEELIKWYNTPDSIEITINGKIYRWHYIWKDSDGQKVVLKIKNKESEIFEDVIVSWVDLKSIKKVDDEQVKKFTKLYQIEKNKLQIKQEKLNTIIKEFPKEWLFSLDIWGKNLVIESKNWKFFINNNWTDTKKSLEVSIRAKSNWKIEVFYITTTKINKDVHSFSNTSILTWELNSVKVLDGTKNNKNVSELLWRTLDRKEENAILKAHKVWNNRLWSWIGNYSFSEIREKNKILKDAWFNKDDIRKLMKNKIVWREVLSNRDVLDTFNDWDVFKLKIGWKELILRRVTQWYELLDKEWKKISNINIQYNVDWTIEIYKASPSWKINLLKADYVGEVAYINKIEKTTTNDFPILNIGDTIIVKRTDWTHSEAEILVLNDNWTITVGLLVEGSKIKHIYPDQIVQTVK